MRMTFESLLNVRIPFGVNLAVTDLCNSHCEHCILKSIRQDKIPLSREEILRCITECQELGVSTINLLGGEPLMNRDLMEIIQLTDTAKVNLLLFTNGSLLTENASGLKKAGLKRIMVSIDFPEAEKHNAFRRQKGLFEKAVQGIIQAKKKGMLLGVSTTITPKTTVEDLSGIFELCKTLGVCEVFLSKEYDPEKMAFYHDFLDDEFYALVKKVNRNNKYRFGIFYYPFFCDVSFGCTAGATRLYISPYGDITPCECSRKSFGNIRTERLRTVWEKMYRSPHLGFVTKEGCRAKRGII
ncbi:MAG: radical SAM protein [bacterium]